MTAKAFPGIPCFGTAPVPRIGARRGPRAPKAFDAEPMAPNPRRFALLLALGCGAAAGLAQANPDKLDARLLRASDPVAVTNEAARTRLGLQHSDGAAGIEATVHFSADGLAQLRAMGVTVRSVLGDVATLLIPRRRLRDVAALSSVRRVDAPRRPVLRLDQSVPATRASLLRTGANTADWSGGTGRGVLVGIVDTGVDVSHPDFRNPDGTSRVLLYWNQRDDAAGSAPLGDDGQPLYGALCSATMIHQALTGSANGCRIADSYGHGTHVAGIAAGNGQASGFGQPYGRFVGVAPMADLIVANALDDGVGQQNSVLDAVAFMVRTARALRRPIVINLSLGSYFGPRDGTSPLERALDNASGPGVVVVAAAGNEGNVPLRAGGLIEPGQALGIGFNVPAWSTRQTLEGWYDGANQYAVRLGCGGFSTPSVAAGDSYSADTPCGRVEVTSTAPNPSNGDRQILVNLGDGSRYLTSGAWVLGLSAQQIGGSHKFSFVSGENSSDANFTNYVESPHTSEILTDTASARRVIAVASYNTRSSWNSRIGTSTRNDMGELGDLSNFSSRGPRRMCSNASLCPTVMKPEITAPGAYVISAYTSANVWVKPQSLIEADGVHVATVQPNAFAGVLPLYDGSDLPAGANPTWGYGVLDAALAFRASTGYRVGAGWNLLGNTLDTEFGMASLVGSSEQGLGGVTANVVSVWKWDALANQGQGNWAFYAPSMSASQLNLYAQSRGYSVLSSIAPGEGFWVNARQALTLPVRGGAAFDLPASALSANWNLVATGFATAPQALNDALGTASTDNFKSLWAWDNSSMRWYFHAPSLARLGTLGAYTRDKGYLDFAAEAKWLSHGVGFWVNR